MKERMIFLPNFLSYLKNCSQSFSDLPLNEVDSLILSSLAYLHFNDIKYHNKIRDLPSKSLTKYIKGNQHNNLALLEAVTKSSRYQDVEIVFQVEDTNKEEEKQFSALTFLLPDNKMYLAFRGTDATFVGWKEDFNMAFLLPIPSQQEALIYAEKVTKLYPRKFYLGGHSKGGNLAVYAASLLNKSTETRLIKVYSHDGPGFLKEFLYSSNYLTITPKISKTVPAASIIGMLLTTNEEYTIIKSSNQGLLEHDQFSWEVENNAFIKLKKLDDGTIYTNKVINDWISSLSKEERNIFIDTLFKVLNSTNLTTLDELASSWYLKLPIMIKTIYTLDCKHKKYLVKTFKALIITFLKNLRCLK